MSVSYADNDPLVLAHARALLTGPPGTTGHIDADLNDPGTLLAIARTQLGFTRPAAILVMTTLGHIGDPADDEDRAARAVVTALKDALPPGGYLAICDLTSTDPAQNAALRTYNRPAQLPTGHAARNSSPACSTAWNSPVPAWFRSTCGGLTPARSPPPRCPPGVRSPSNSAPGSRHAGLRHP